ncbi:hypothetical protein ACOMHN_063744 [Nucella lapillus]
MMGVMAGRLTAFLLEHVVGFFAFLLPLVSGTIHTVHVDNQANNSYYPVHPPAGFSISTLTRLNFSIRICNDAHLLLSQHSEGGQPLYEIVIGGWGNSQSVLRDKKQQKPPKQSIKNQVPPLNCNEFRAFFASWKNGLIRVGSVTNDAQKTENVFITYDHGSLAFPIHFAFVAGWNAAGQWRFDFIDDDETTVGPIMTTEEMKTTTSNFIDDDETTVDPIITTEEMKTTTSNFIDDDETTVGPIITTEEMKTTTSNFIDDDETTVGPIMTTEEMKTTTTSSEF